MIKNLLLLASLTLFVQCGFKPVDTSLSSLNVKSVDIKGYNKVNFFIKNDLMNKISDAESKLPIDIKIITKRKKEVSEKNIRNEITKYKITFNTKIEVKKTNLEKLKVFNVSASGNYRVETSSIQTSKNLNNLEKKLSNEISKEIKQKLFFLSNDL